MGEVRLEPELELEIRCREEDDRDERELCGEGMTLLLGEGMTLL